MELIPGVTEVYVSDESVEDAINCRSKHIYLGTFNGLYLCVASRYEAGFKYGMSFETNCWKYSVPVESVTKQVEELTMEEVCKQLGKKIKIVEKH